MLENLACILSSSNREREMKNLRINTNTSILIAIGYSFVLQSAFANEEDLSLSYCNQQLVQASASCLDSDTLESCILESLKSSGCEIEIVTEDNINVCNDTCAPVATSSVSENDETEAKKNILSLTEGE